MEVCGGFRLLVLTPRKCLLITRAGLGVGAKRRLLTSEARECHMFTCQIEPKFECYWRNKMSEHFPNYETWKSSIQYNYMVFKMLNKLPSKTRYWKKERRKEGRKGRKDKEEDVSSCWMNLRKREDTGSIRCHFMGNVLCKRLWT